MAKDARGVTINEGDVILFNGLMMTITKISGGSLLGAVGHIQGNRVPAMIMPGELSCECKIQFDPSPDKGIPCYVLKNPSNQDQAVEKKGMQA